MKNLVGRAAFRVEGNWWVAYYAMPDTMDDAVEIARIQMTAVFPNRDRKAAFMALIRKAAFMALIQGFIAELLAEYTGEEPSWNDPASAPEHERAGRA